MSERIYDYFATVGMAGNEFIATDINNINKS
jgi:hypothetical protein